MPVYSRQFLSGVPSGGLPFTVTATSDLTAQTLHQVQATSTSAIEMVWLSLVNGGSAARVARIVLESATATNTVRITMADRTAATGPYVLFQGLPLTGTDTIIKGYATLTSGDAYTVHGYVNRIAT